MLQFFKYTGAAVASLIADYVVFFLLFTLAGLPLVGAQGIARLSGGLTSYLINLKVSFKASTGHRVSVTARRFILLYIVSYVISIRLLLFLHETLGIQAYSAKVIADCSCFLFNFMVMKLYVYSDRRSLSGFVRTKVGKTLDLDRVGSKDVSKTSAF